MKSPTKKKKDPIAPISTPKKSVPKKLNVATPPEDSKKQTEKASASKDSEATAEGEHYFFPVTGDLRASAAHLEKEFDVYFDRMRTANDPKYQRWNYRVLVKCLDPQHAAELTRRSEDVDLIYPFNSLMISNNDRYAKLELQYSDEVARIRKEVCIPWFFFDMLSELRITRLDSHRIHADMRLGIQHFLAVFNEIEIMWMKFECNDFLSDVIDIYDVNRRLLRLLKTINETAEPKMPIPRAVVTISKTDGNWTFQVDGKPINATENAAKALATLVVIGDKEFHLLEFDKIFRGYSKSEYVTPPDVPGHAFDNKVSRLRKKLKFVKPPNKNNYRKLVNADFQIEPLTSEDLWNFLLSRKRKTS